MAACTTVKNAKKEQSLVDKKKAKKRKEYLASIAMMKPLDPASERERKERKYNSRCFLQCEIA